MKIFRYLIYFGLFFLLFYLENITIIGSFTFSQAWKIPLIIFMIFYVFRHNINRRPKFNRVAYLVGFKNFFNQGFFTFPLTNIIEGFRFTNFPLLYDTLNIYFKGVAKLNFFLIRISQYFILSSIPYFMGILKSTQEGLEFGENLSFIGVFQNSHATSIITSLSLIVLIHNLKICKLTLAVRFFNILLIIFGVYILYLAFIRTGYLMFIVGVLILFIPSRINIRQLISFSVITFILGISFYSLMETNSAFRRRILDENKRDEQMDVGSGRLIFAKHSIEYWVNGNFQQLMFGRGLEEVKNNMQKKTGQRIFSHNGFVDALAVNGIIGITLMLIFLMFIYKNIRRNKEANAYRLSLAVFFCYLAFQLTQGGTAFGIDLIMVATLALLNKQGIIINQNYLSVNSPYKNLNSPKINFL